MCPGVMKAAALKRLGDAVIHQEAGPSPQPLGGWFRQRLHVTNRSTYIPGTFPYLWLEVTLHLPNIDRDCKDSTVFLIGMRPLLWT